MPVPRDLAVRFVVTQNDITKEEEKIKAGLVDVNRQIAAMGTSLDGLSAAQKRGLMDMLRVQENWDKTAKYIRQALEVELQLNSAMKAGAINATEFADKLKQAREAIARAAAEQQRLNDERRRSQGFGGAGPGVSKSEQEWLNSLLIRGYDATQKFKAGLDVLKRGLADGTITNAQYTQGLNSIQKVLSDAVRKEDEAAAAATRAREARIAAYAKIVPPAEHFARALEHINNQYAAGQVSAAQYTKQVERQLQVFEQHSAISAKFNLPISVRSAAATSAQYGNLNNTLSQITQKGEREAWLRDQKETAERTAALNRAMADEATRMYNAAKDRAKQAATDQNTLNSVLDRGHDAYKKFASVMAAARRELDANRLSTADYNKVLQQQSALLSDALRKEAEAAAAATRAREARIAAYAKIVSPAEQFARALEHINKQYLSGQTSAAQYTKQVERQMQVFDRNTAISNKLNDPLSARNAAATAMKYEKAMEGIGAITQKNTKAMYEFEEAQKRAARSAARFSEQSIANFKAASEGGKGFLGTINDISFKLFLLTFVTQQTAGMILHTFVQTGEKVELLKFKLENLTKSTQTFGFAFEAAQSLGVEMDTLGGALTRFAVANQSMGMSNKLLVEMARNAAALGQLGGAGAQEMRAGLIQLGQALASNKLAGDELRSVFENLPLLAVKLSEKLSGGSIAKLREMGSTGELTAQKVSEAILSMSDDIEKSLQNIPQTSEMALARLQNQWALFINQTLNAVGIETAGNAIGIFTGYLKDLSDWVSGHQTETASALGALWDVTKLVAMVAAIQYFLRILYGITAAYMASVNAKLAYAAATQAQAVAEANLAKAAGSAAAAIALADAKAKTAAANTARSAARWALLGSFGTLATLIGLAAVAWTLYSQKQQDAADKTEESIRRMQDAVQKGFVGMSRTQIVALSVGAKMAIEQTNKSMDDMLAEIESKQREIARWSTVNNDPAMAARYASLGMNINTAAAQKTQQLTNEIMLLQEEVDKYNATNAEMNSGIEAAGQAMNGSALAAAAMAQAVADADKASKNFATTLKDLNMKIFENRMKLQYIPQQGVEQAGATSDTAVIQRTASYMRMGVLNNAATGYQAVERLRTALEALKASGTATADELAKAQTAYNGGLSLLLENLKLVDLEEQKRLEVARTDYQVRMATRAAGGSTGGTSKADNEYLDNVKRSIDLTDTQTERLRALLPVIDDVSKRWGVQKEMIIAVAKAESSFNQAATSPKGARGVMQIMPKTAEDLAQKLRTTADKVLNDAETNLNAGTMYLRDLMQKWGTIGGLRAYNSGAPSGRGGKETNDYADKIPKDYERLMMGAGDADKFLEDQRNQLQRNEDALHESRMRMLAIDQDYTARYQELVETRKQKDLEVDRQQAQLDDATRKQMKLANEAEMLEGIRKLNREHNVLLRNDYASFEQETAAMRLQAEQRITEYSTTWGEKRKAEEIRIRTETAQKVAELQRNLDATEPSSQAEKLKWQQLYADRVVALWQDADAQIKALDLERTREMADEIGQAFGEAFGSLAKGGESAQEVFRRLLEAIRDTIIQLTIIKPLAEQVAGAINSSGIASWLTGAVSSVAGSAVSGSAGYGGGFGTAATGSVMRFAHGGMTSTGLPPGVYAHPTYFRTDVPGHRAFAKGTGVLGEAGPEAILPLRRGADGKLGVASDGAQVNVVVKNLPGQTAAVTQDGDTVTIEVVRAVVADDIRRGGNQIARALDYAGRRGSR